MIHPTAILHARAEVDPSCEIGPFAVIDEGVSLGPECVIGPQVHLTGTTTIGRGNRFHAGCVIGDAPQDLKYRGEPTRLLIGEDNVFREHVTVHRSNKLEEATTIGSHNLLMANSHVGHNVVLGDHVVMVNGALLAGHVTVADRVFISGHAAVHQFVRLGTLALMQGQSGITKDLPPYTIATALNSICGLNVIGLRRAGFTPAERLELRELYRRLFRSGLPMRQALEAASAEFTGTHARALIEFVASSKRGVCTHVDRAEPAAAE